MVTEVSKRQSAATRRTGARWSRGLAMVLSVLLVAAGCNAGPGAAPAGPAPGAAAGAAVAGAAVGTGAFDSATRDDAEFNRRFRHEFAQVGGVRMHYVTGGTGEPLVLLHGWPQSWYEWRGVMPALADRYTVYALDLPGLGDSEGAPPSYDKATLARLVHGLLAGKLGLRKVNLVGHDLGAGVGFRYAAQYPGEVTKYAHLDYPLPGPALSAAKYRSLSWHLAFHAQEAFPETVVANDVRRYLALFYPYVAYGGKSFGGTRTTSPFSEREVDEYARTYSRPQVLTGGFGLYRTLDQDERDNVATAPVAVPTLLMTAGGLLPFTRSTVRPRLSRLTRAVEVPGSGHWLPEENPKFVISQLLAFFAG